MLMALLVAWSGKERETVCEVLRRVPKEGAIGKVRLGYKTTSEGHLEHIFHRLHRSVANDKE